MEEKLNAWLLTDKDYPISIKPVITNKIIDILGGDSKASFMDLLKKESNAYKEEYGHYDILTSLFNVLKENYFLQKDIIEAHEKERFLEIIERPYLNSLFTYQNSAEKEKQIMDMLNPLFKAKTELGIEKNLLIKKEMDKKLESFKSIRKKIEEHDAWKKKISKTRFGLSKILQILNWEKFKSIEKVLKEELDEVVEELNGLSSDLTKNLEWLFYGQQDDVINNEFNKLKEIFFSIKLIEEECDNEFRNINIFYRKKVNISLDEKDDVDFSSEVYKSRRKINKYLEKKNETIESNSKEKLFTVRVDHLRTNDIGDYADIEYYEDMEYERIRIIKPLINKNENYKRIDYGNIMKKIYKVISSKMNNEILNRNYAESIREEENNNLGKIEVITLATNSKNDDDNNNMIINGFEALNDILPFIYDKLEYKKLLALLVLSTNKSVENLLSETEEIKVLLNVGEKKIPSGVKNYIREKIEKIVEKSLVEILEFVIENGRDSGLRVLLMEKDIEKYMESGFLEKKVVLNRRKI